MTKRKEEMAPDPFQRPDFGGTPQELQRVFRYRRAIKDLRQRNSNWKETWPKGGGQKDGEGGEGEGDEDADEEKVPKKTGRGGRGGGKK